MAEAPAVVLQQLQELILDAVHCTWEDIQQLLKKCTGLHKLELFGMSACIFNPPGAGLCSAVLCSAGLGCAVQ